MKKVVSILLALILSAAGLTACGTAGSDKNAAGATVSKAESDETTVETTAAEPEYVYPSVNYEGKALRIYNINELWDMYVDLDQPELTGEALNDAVYERNRRVEDKLGCVIEEKEIANTSNDLAKYTKTAMDSILAGEDSYDVMYLPMSQNISIITDGYLMNLLDIPELNLSETWWDQDVITPSTFGDKLYFATNSMHLMAFDGTWCLFFNEDMVANKGLDLPYNLVRDGKWTLDSLGTYLTAAANLNGDDAFGWKDGNNCVYGISCHYTSTIDRFIYSCGERYVSGDSNNKLKASADNTRFYSVVEKLATILNQSTGMAIRADNDDFNASLGGYMYVYKTGRSMFLAAEIKGAQLLRDMDDALGMLPFPKYDETQENYQSTIVSAAFFYTIPVTCSDVSFTASVSDALCYESYKTVVPVYYDITVSQKGLRNEDSIEMMEIMRSTRGIDISTILNWSANLYADLTTSVFKGDSQVSSIVAKYTPKIDENISKFMEFIDK